MIKRSAASAVICAFLLFVLQYYSFAQSENDDDKVIYIPHISSGDSVKSIKSLVKDIEDVIREKKITDTDYSIAVYSFDQKKYHYKKNIETPLTPASLTKLFTSYSALKLLGYDFMLRTVVFADTVVTKDSVLHGDLYIIGYGDALLTVADIEHLADVVKAHGIKKITGNVFADVSFFDEKTDRLVYSGDDDRVEPLPPITALSLERNTATVLVQSGNRAGLPLNVQIVPGSESFIIENTAKVRAYSKKSGSLKPEYIEYYDAQMFGDANPEPTPLRSWSSVKIRSKPDTADLQKITVSGYLYPNKTYSYRHYILQPGLAAAGCLKDRLISGGVDVAGGIGYRSKDTADMFNLAECSKPLIELCSLLTKNSDNYLAENVFKLIGAGNAIGKDNAVQARKYQKALFRSTGIPFDKCKLNDGSGLSRRNLLTVQSVITLLIKARQEAFAGVFDSTMSVAAFDGTLKKRMADTPAENNLRGKTGTLRNVSGLAGYTNTLDGELLAFAIIWNGNYIGRYKEAEDEIGILLSQFFYFNEEY